MASMDSQRTDALGARASNAGDQYQELWALQHALGLLNPSTGLAAVTVEGIASETVGEDHGVWDGVDCALYYEGKTLETASRVVIEQLKYSTTAPEDNWTVARLASNSKKSGNNSVLRRLADAFRGAKSRMKPDAELRIGLISNQGVASDVFNVVGVLRGGEPAPNDRKLPTNIEKFKIALGLSDEELPAFLNLLELSKGGTPSRYSLRGSITKHVAQILGEDESATVRELMFSVRELMMPGKSREFISRETILGWFGVAAETGLFPAPSDFKTVTHPIEREPARALLAAIREGRNVICLHGSAGCGKTTTLMQLRSLLPPSSVLSLFDCYGGGRYLFTTDRRHLPEHAFTQIANELSLDLGIPFLLARGSKSPIFVKRFLERIKLAAELLSKSDSEAILVVGIDAADNSVTAAVRPTPPDACFVTELAQADLATLPANVRLVFSARTVRKDSLRLPNSALYVSCPAFSQDETESFAKRILPSVSSDWVSQFHALSNGIPRVQDYAIRAGNSDPLATLNALRPGGKDLTDVLRKLFQEAMQKSGNDASYAFLMSCLAALPAPIPPDHLAKICGLQATEIIDFVQDTQPGLRLEDEGISIADEDVEDFIRAEGMQELQQARQRACDYFKPIHASDTYAAVNYADLLAAAGRAIEILPIIDKNLSPTAIADPIVKREVQVRRLRLAHAACRAAGDSAATMQVVLLGAEAAKDEAFLAEILDRHPDLSIRFARSSLVRLVLSDADNAKRQGRVLVQDAVRAARAGNKIQARDQLHYYDEWLSRRRKAPKNERDGWRIEIDDIVANVEAVAILDGLAEAYRELTRWKSRQLHLSVALKLIPRLIAQGNADIVEKAVQDRLLPPAWEILFFVPLALSGTKIEVSLLEKSLMALRRALIPALKGIRHADFGDRWDPQLRELLITACEIGFSLGVSETAIRKALNLAVDLDGPFEKHYSSFEPDILDIISRAWLLRRLLDNRSHTADEFLDFIDPPPPPKEEVTPKVKASKASEKNRPQEDRLEDEQKHMVKTVLPVYASRIPFLDHHRKNGKVGQDQINGLGGFGSDEYSLRRHDGIGIRARTAASVLNLMHLNGGSWEALFAKASGLASPGYSDPFGRHLLPLWRFLLLRLDSRDFVLHSLAERTPALRTVREPATDKVDAAIDFSRLALIFSEPDARAFFEDAISLAQEIDREAVNQIGVLEALTTHSGGWDPNAKKVAAPALVNVLTDIAQRLRNQDHFPWEGCINSLARLQPSAALAALSRWSDQGIQDHADNLIHFLFEMGRLDELSPTVAASLLALIPAPPDQLKSDIVAKLGTTGEALAGKTIDLLAEDCLLQEGPTLIFKSASALIAATSSLGVRPKQPSYQRLLETHRYLKSKKTSPSPKREDKERTPKLCGHSFTSKAAIEAEFNSAREREGKGYFRTGPFLAQMIDTVTSPGDRVPFLDALSASDFGDYNEGERAEVILTALSKWDTPSVNHWRSHTFPKVIVQRFLGLTRLYGWRSQHLQNSLAATRLKNSQKLDLLAEGLESTSLSLGSESLFVISEQMAEFLAPEKAWELFDWYLGRISSRVSIDESALKQEDIPNDLDDAVGRLMLALMSDIDTRIRWRGTHTMRRLARLEATDTLEAIFSQYERRTDDAFRDPASPYYWQAARLWAVIAVARIAHETPQSLRGIHRKLLEIATDVGFPHVLIREYAKAAIIALHDSGEVPLDDTLAEKIRAINTSPFPPDTRKEHSVTRLQWSDKKGERFDFGMDTAEHVLGPILRMFIGLPKEELFQSLEHWLIDQWHAPEKVNYWDREPRKARYDERQWGLHHSDKGSMPVVERYGYYLEWHAILCVVGDVLQKYPLWKGENDYWGSFTYWFSKMLLSLPPVWLADLRDPKPLEDQFWTANAQDENRWVSRMSRQDFFAALFADGGNDHSVVNVDGTWTSAFPTREVSANISSALINPATASALARSLSTRDTRWPYHLPNADPDDRYDGQFHDMPYKLMGWLVEPHNNEGIDVKDALRNGIKGRAKYPADQVLLKLRLEAGPLPEKSWKPVDSRDAVIKEVVWSDLPERFDYNSSPYRSRETKSEGSLLQINADVLLSYLKMEQMDLIVGVHFERRLEQEYGRYDERTKKSKTFERFFIFRADGTIEDYRGIVGAWWRTR